MTNIETPPASGKVEAKVWAATWGAFLASLAGLTLLQSTVTDMVPSLPDWLESPAYALVASAVTLVSGYVKRSKPAQLSESTVEAIREWMRKRAPRPGAGGMGG